MNKSKLLKINCVKKRSSFNPWLAYISDLKETGQYFDDLYNKKGITDIRSYEYIPVTIVACFQSFFRFKIQELLNIGEPYLGNSKKLTEIKNLKLELNDLLEINCKIRLN
jgi:hypothetical protein